LIPRRNIVTGGLFGGVLGALGADDVEAVRAVSQVFVWLLVVAMGAGSDLLNGCLVSCHSGSGAKNARTGHCHTAPTSIAGSRLQSPPRCCHDASSALADTNDNRVNVAAPSFVAEIVFDPSSVSAPRRTAVTRRHLPALPELDSTPTPLRL
jgi:hypothetical protein